MSKYAEALKDLDSWVDINCDKAKLCQLISKKLTKKMDNVIALTQKVLKFQVSTILMPSH